MRFSLQDMVRQTLADAEEREKTAQAAEGAEDESKKKKDKQGPPAEQASNGSQSAPERNEESYEEKTSGVFVEKLASAVEYCNEHFLKEAVGKPEPPRTATPPQTTVGAGKGATATETTMDSPTGGMQSEETGQASKNQIAVNPGSDVKSPGQVNPSTAMETDMNDRPGGNEDWSKGQDKMKQAQAPEDKVRAFLQSKDEKKEGGDEEEGKSDEEKAKEAQILRVVGVMDKMAEDAINPAKLAAGSEPLENPNASQAEEKVPSQPAETSKQESMVSSNEKATNYTKQQAKAVPKARMGEVLSEPAQKKSSDPVLHNNLDAASGAGVKLSSATKVAAARALLHKIAEEGAKEDASPEEKERASKLQEVLKAKQQEKESSACKQGSATPLSGGY
jgi:hypothetical protein